MEIFGGIFFIQEVCLELGELQYVTKPHWSVSSLQNSLPQHVVVKLNESLTVQSVIGVEINQLSFTDVDQSISGFRDKRIHVFDDESILIVHSPIFNQSSLRFVRYDSLGRLLYNLT